MFICVTGGRDLHLSWSQQAVDMAIDEIVRQHPGITGLIHGGARGADTMSGDWAMRRGLDIRVFMADWDQYGKSAGPRRNTEMLNQNPAFLVAFPGGRGTAHMVSSAKSRNIHVIYLSPPPPPPSKGDGWLMFPNV